MEKSTIMAFMDWKEYENEVVAYLESKFLGCRVQKNVKLPGRKSKTQRQIDVLIEPRFK